MNEERWADSAATQKYLFQARKLFDNNCYLAGGLLLFTSIAWYYRHQKQPRGQYAWEGAWLLEITKNPKVSQKDILLINKAFALREQINLMENIGTYISIYWDVLELLTQMENKVVFDKDLTIPSALTRYQLHVITELKTKIQVATNQCLLVTFKECLSALEANCLSGAVAALWLCLQGPRRFSFDGEGGVRLERMGNKVVTGSVPQVILLRKMRNRALHENQPPEPKKLILSLQFVAQKLIIDPHLNNKATIDETIAVLTRMSKGERVAKIIKEEQTISRASLTSIAHLIAMNPKLPIKHKKRLKSLYPWLFLNKK